MRFGWHEQQECDEYAREERGRAKDKSQNSVGLGAETPPALSWSISLRCGCECSYLLSLYLNKGRDNDQKDSHFGGGKGHRWIQPCTRGAHQPSIDLSGLSTLGNPCIHAAIDTPRHPRAKKKNSGKGRCHDASEICMTKNQPIQKFLLEIPIVHGGTDI